MTENNAVYHDYAVEQIEKLTLTARQAITTM